MVQRFFIRLACFALLALVVSLLILRSVEIFSVPHWLWLSALLLGVVYSWRLVVPRFGAIAGLLFKCGFIAVLFKSLPGVLLVLAAGALLCSLLPAACLAMGAAGALWELADAIRMDRSR